MTAGKQNDRDQILMDALQHPLRRKLFRLAIEREEVSPAEASKALDEVLSNVSYHMTQLAKMDVVRLNGTAQARGAVVHFYVPNLEVAKLPWVREVIGLGD